MKKKFLIGIVIFFAIIVFGALFMGDDATEQSPDMDTTIEETIEVYENLSKTEEASDELTEAEDSSDKLENTSENEENNTGEATTKAEVTAKSESVTLAPGTTDHVHSFSAATCTEAEKCLCGAINGSVKAHSFSEGKCSVCGAKDPNYTNDIIVWIPTHGGTKYHCRSGCSNMKDPIEVTKSEAINRGFGPCGRCY